MIKRFLIMLTAILAVAFVSLNTTWAAIVSLDFNSLPSAQGWGYYSTGGLAEADVMTLDAGGTTLTIDTIGLGNKSGNYRYNNIIDPNLPYTISTTARVTNDENLGGDGFAFTFGTLANASSIGAGFDLQYVYFGGRAYTHPVDPTVFHDYRIEANPGSGTASLYIDNIFRFSDSLHTEALNQLLLGDATTYENVYAEVTSYEFSQVPISGAVYLLGTALIGIAGYRKKFMK